MRETKKRKERERARGESERERDITRMPSYAVPDEAGKMWVLRA